MYRTQEHATAQRVLDPSLISLNSVASLNQTATTISVATPQQPHAFEAIQPVPLAGKWHRFSIIVFIVAGNMLQMISNMVGLAGGLEIAKALGADGSPSHASWAAASYPLTQGTFVLVSGRLGAVYGHRNVLVCGAVWLIIWSLVTGFCKSFVAFNIARALSGIGGALIMPNAVALISTTIPPGKTRNVTLGFFGASAPVGGWLGAICAGVLIKYASWEWIFFSLTFIGAFFFGILFVLVPQDEPVDKNGTIDWFGAALGISALIIFNVAWNQAPSSGWDDRVVITLLVLSVLLLAFFGIWEFKFIKDPIMPLDIWTAPSFAVLVFVVLLSYMATGVNIWYMLSWLQILRGESILQFGIQWTPFGVVATTGTFIAAWLIPLLAAQWILAIGSGSILVANVLLATMPVYQTYWAQVFPATIFSALCPDFVYVAAQIIASNSVRREQQGIAASLIGILNLYGNSLGLGFAGTIETQVAKHGSDQVLGYRAALYFGAGIALLATLLDGLFVRIVKDEREGWADPADAEAESSSAFDQGVSTAIELDT